MNDLISRQAAIDAFHPDHDTDWYTPWIIETLNELPTADVVEVIMCEHCRHCEHRNNEEPYCHQHAMVVTPDYFCADGEEGEWMP